MSYWQVILGVSLSAVSGSVVASDRSMLDALYGKPIRSTLRGVRIDYDGRDAISIRAARHRFTVPAKSPAQISVSPGGRFLAHNFGSGSGQIYDLSIYALPRGSIEPIGRFKQRVLRTAHARRNCKARLNQISFLVDRWLSPTTIKIRTEDWTRRPGCDVLNRAWTMKVR